MKIKGKDLVNLDVDINHIDASKFNIKNSNMEISPLEYNTANNINWCIGNVIKYVSRYKNKNGIENLEKAKWYLNYQIKLEKGNKHILDNLKNVIMT